MVLLAELRARYFVLSHTGCSRPTGCREVAERLVTLRANPELQFEVDRLAKKAIQVTWAAWPESSGLIKSVLIFKPLAASVAAS